MEYPPWCMVLLQNLIVDIAGPSNALLPQLSFEGATRRNRPNLQIGDLVYARVVQATKDMDPVLSCVDASGKASGFGQLKGGTYTTCMSSYARILLGQPPAPVLQALSEAVQFEIAVGLNGRVWVDSPSCSTTVLVCNAIQRAAALPSSKVADMVKALVAEAGGSD